MPPGLPSPKLAQLLLVSLAGLGCSPKSPPPNGEVAADERRPIAAEPEPASDGDLERARAITKAFATTLQTTLLSAIEAGGPAHAISVCKHDAPKIAADQASEGWTLARTALRVRNPNNAPSEWQRAVLEDWQAQIEAGTVTDVAALEWSEVDDGQLRYMRAIPLGGVCLTCHGPKDELAPEVTAALAEQYPDDQAVGFHVGELRGAFVVTGPT